MLGRRAYGAAFVIYLLALAGLGFSWLSPLRSLSEQAIWSDLLLALAAVTWLLAAALGQRELKLRAFHLLLFAYVAATALSATFASDSQTAVVNLLIAAELVLLAAMTSSFASNRDRLRWIVLVVLGLALVTAALVLIALTLFYLGERTALLGAYGEQFISSDTYARVRAGFESPPLLGSFAIFASAVLAKGKAALPAWLYRTTQCALAAVVVATLSRAVIGFAIAFAIRFGWEHRERSAARIFATASVVAGLMVIVALTAGRLHLDPTRPATVTYEVPDPGNRREAIATSLDTVSEHPLFGEGPGALVGENRGQPFRAHLTPLNVLATTGPLSLVALVALFVVLWRRRGRPTDIAIWSGLAGLALDGLAQDAEHFRHVWVLIGLADARIGREQPLAQDRPPRA